MSRWFYQVQFSDAQRKVLLKNIQRRLKRGMTGVQIAESLVQMFAKDPVLQMVAADMRNASRAGLGLTASFDGWFDNSLLATMRIAESHGKLGEEIETLIKEIEGAGSAMAEVLKAFAYGVLIISVLVGVFITIVHDQLAPVLTSIANSPTPDLVRLIAVAEFCNSYWHLFIAIPVGIFSFYYLALLNLVGKARARLDTTPIFSMYRRLQGGRMLNSMGLMTNAGLTWRQAAGALMQNANRYIRFALVQFLHKLDEGGSVPDSLEHADVFEDVVLFELKGAADDAELPMVAREIAQEIVERTITDLEKVSGQVRTFALLLAGTGLIILVTGLMAVSQSI